jgi:hypothetical protein
VIYLPLLALRRELRAADAAARRQDCADLQDARRADLRWMLAGAGLVTTGAALLGGLLALFTLFRAGSPGLQAGEESACPHSGQEPVTRDFDRFRLCSQLAAVGDSSGRSSQARPG